MQHIHHLALKGLSPLLSSRFRLSKFSGEFGVARFCDDTQNTLSDPSGEFVGPLVYRLVGDAHDLSGSGDRTAEDFNGL